MFSALLTWILIYRKYIFHLNPAVFFVLTLVSSCHLIIADSFVQLFHYAVFNNSPLYGHRLLLFRKRIQIWEEHVFCPVYSPSVMELTLCIPGNANRAGQSASWWTQWMSHLWASYSRALLLPFVCWIDIVNACLRAQFCLTVEVGL